MNFLIRTWYAALGAAVVIYLFSSCSTLNIGQTPAQVQADITTLGALAKPYIPAADQARIHALATQLNSASNFDLATILALIPNLSNPKAQALVSAVIAYLKAAPGYSHAVANGLLADF
jgi:hypothetical protein